MPPKTTKKNRKNATKAKGTTRRSSKFACPECDFVAKHAMGLGRHRSARHGVPSLRQRRLSAPRPTAPKIPEGWLSRRDAASRAGVHYNTVRIWERAGKVRTNTLGNQTLIHAGDFEKLIANRTASPRGSNTPAPEVLEKLDDLTDRFHDLADALELLSRQIRPRRRRSGRGQA